jgi:hypothetical protein
MRAASPSPTAKRFPLLAWIGPPANETSVERYRELADAGFNLNFSSFPDVESMAIALDVAENAGVRQFISIPELERDPEGVVTRFRSHPALAGYHLRDEPSVSDFPKLGEWMRRIQKLDGEHGAYINLFPTYASPAQLGAADYPAYLERFFADVPVPYLSYDHYSITSRGLREGYYENLEFGARYAREHRVPLWAFVLAVAHDPYPVPTPAHLRLQAFSNLAYGVQCIQYFTYWTPESTVWNFHQGPIEKDGKRTEVYDRVKQMNAEIQSLAPLFLGAALIWPAHVGPLPRGTHPYAPASPITHVTAEGGALVSRLRNRSRELLAIVNRSYTDPLSLRVGHDGSRRLTRHVPGAPGTPVRRKELTETLEPGAIVVLSWASTTE